MPNVIQFVNIILQNTFGKHIYMLNSFIHKFTFVRKRLQDGLKINKGPGRKVLHQKIYFMLLYYLHSIFPFIDIFAVAQTFEVTFVRRKSLLMCLENDFTTSNVSPIREKLERGSNEWNHRDNEFKLKVGTFSLDSLSNLFNWLEEMVCT